MRKILVVLMMLLAFSTQAFALNVFENDKVKFDIYGQIYLSLAHQTIYGDGKETNNDFFMSIYPCSVLGTDLKVGNFMAKAEVNYKGDGENGFGFRKLYGAYDFGKGGILKIGQDTSILGTGWSTDIYFGWNATIGFGAINAVRRPMFHYSVQGFNIALISNARDLVDFGDGWVKNQTLMPRVEMSYNFPQVDFPLIIGAGYTTINQKNAELNMSQDVHAGTAMFLAYPTFGNVSLFVSAFYSLNGSTFGNVWSYDGTVAGINSYGYNPSGLLLPKIYSDGSVHNVQTAGTAIELGYNFTPKIKIAVGGGYQISFSDFYDKTANKDFLNSYAAYILAQFWLNDYFAITPQIGYYSSDRPDIDQTDSTFIAGAEFRVVF